MLPAGFELAVPSDHVYTEAGCIRHCRLCVTYEGNAAIFLLKDLLCEYDYSSKVQPNVSEV